MITTFTIDRSKWLNGSISYDSAMRDTKGRMCCLGFYGKACGVKAKAMTGIGYPHQLDATAVPDEMHWLIEEFGAFNTGRGRNTPHCTQLVGDNDSDLLAKREREARIKKGFKEAGITVKFVGRYPAKAKKAK